jgi:hypothetical protein
MNEESLDMHESILESPDIPIVFLSHWGNMCHSPMIWSRLAVYSETGGYSIREQTIRPEGPTGPAFHDAMEYAIFEKNMRECPRQEKMLEKTETFIAAIQHFACYKETKYSKITIFFGPYNTKTFHSWNKNLNRIYGWSPWVRTTRFDDPVRVLVAERSGEKVYSIYVGFQVWNNGGAIRLFDAINAYQDKYMLPDFINRYEYLLSNQA